MAESLEHYARTVERMITEQRVLDSLRAEMKKPIPAVRRSVKARALSTLPKRGGLNKWVAAIQVKSRTATAGTSIRIRLSGGRNSAGGRSDIKRLDAGRVRAPSWGRKGGGQWHSQTVPAGFFTEPVTEEQPWLEAADRGLDKALEVIR